MRRPAGGGARGAPPRLRPIEVAASELDLARAEELLPRYAMAGPRYTSYPPAPVWSETFGPEPYGEALAAAGRRAGEGLSLYVHVPFCRSLCHFCACNRVITRRPEPPARFLDAVLRELARVREALGSERTVMQHHWGGGTPTHLSPDQVPRLFRGACDAFPLRPTAEVSIEVDPRVTTEAHVDALRECGFRRVSMGVQDFDPRVQAAIHRVQPPAATARLVERARGAGFESVGFDLIYGLPFQSVPSFERTLDEVLALAPDRVALYAYAHVTWVAKQQRGFERGDLPDPRARLRIFLAAVRRFLAAGYVWVGLDHFARPEDELAAALRDGTLRRNFMGYTTLAGTDLVAFGPSGIAELSDCYAQSHRDLERWEAAVRAGRLPTLRGFALSEDDRDRRFAIARLMCLGELRADDFTRARGGELRARLGVALARLAPLERDGLVEVDAAGSVCVTALGRLFLRNVAMAFDAYLPGEERAGGPRYSQTV